MSFVEYGPVRGIVSDVTVLSPTFRRITFSGQQLDSLAAEGPFYDQRIKIVLPNAADRLPQIPDKPDWYQAWLSLPDDQRGIMRTYSIRDLRRADGATYLSIDFVIHSDHNGSTGPASAWASMAQPGDELLIVAPRAGTPALGTEFDPGQADQIVLLGDEAAAPAISRILEDLRTADHVAQVCAYIEVPTKKDQLTVDTDAEIHWLPRESSQLGTPLAEALGWYLNHDTSEQDPDLDTLLWETPEFSASGETLTTAPAPKAGTYYWIAGESGLIKRLRRFLVNDVGVHRSQVAFMGYWRHGVAMRG